MTHTCLTILKPSTGGASNLESASYITIRLLEFDGTNDAEPQDSAFRIAGNGTHVLFEDVEVHNYLGVGFFVPASVGSIPDFTTFRRINTHDNARASTGATEGPFHGIYGAGTNILVEYSNASNNGFPWYNSNGLQLYDSLSTIGADNAIVRNNSCPEPAGLVMDGKNVQAYNNIITDNNIGIDHGYSPCPTGGKFYNNLIANNSTRGVELGISAPCGVSADFSNNHIVGNGTNILFIGGATITGSNNRTTGTVTDCTVSTADFRPKAGSACIDAGKVLSTVTIDFVGVVRPQGASYDIGAYEQTTGSDSQPPNPPVGLVVR